MTTFNNAEFSKVATIAARAEKAGEAKITTLVAMVETITTPEDYKSARHAYIAARLAVFEGADVGNLYDTKGTSGFPDGARDTRVQRAACAWQYLTSRAQLSGWATPIAPGAVKTGRKNKPKTAPKGKEEPSTTLELSEPLALAFAFLAKNETLHPEFMAWIQPFMHPVAARPASKKTTRAKTRAMAAIDDMETTD